MFIAKIMRSMNPQDSVIKCTNDLEKQGFKVEHIEAFAQSSLFGEEDSLVFIEVERR